jgi:hypothetical protein
MVRENRKSEGTGNLSMSAYTVITINLAAKQMGNFIYLLQQGVMVKVHEGCSIRTLLHGHLGISPDYIEKHIRVFLLNGRAVDDIDSAVIRDGSTLALSTAMPGLVGATLRRGSPFAVLRSEVTHSESEKCKSSEKEVIVTVKLFNVLITKLGPLFLEKGIWLSGAALEELLRNQPDEFWAVCQKVERDGKPLDVKALRGMKWSDELGLLHLRVITGRSV